MGPTSFISDMEQDGNGVYNIYDDIKKSKSLSGPIKKDDLKDFLKDRDINKDGKWDYQDRIELIKRSGIELKPAQTEALKDYFQKYFGGKSWTVDDIWDAYNSEG